MTRPLTARLLGAFAVATLLAPGCGKPPAQRQQSVAETAPGTVAKKPVRKYDDEGIRMPSDELPMGTPVPVGLSEVSSGSGWVRFVGQVRPQEVTDFYRKYLTLPEGTAPHEVGRSILFRNARPVQPGNPGRQVEVRVIPEQGGTRTAVLILDQDFASRMSDEELSGVKTMGPEDWKPTKPGEVPPEDLL